MDFINLDHRVLPLPVDYVRQLYDHISELYDEINDLNGKLARSGNQYYQRDAAAMGKQWQELNIEFGTLQREKIANEAKLQAEIDRLTFLNQQLQADLDVAEARLSGMVAVEVVDKPKTSYLPDRNANGTFKSVPKTREQLAAEYHAQGLKNTEIAGLLGVNPDTVRRYLQRFEQKKAETERLLQLEVKAQDDKKESERWQNFETYGFTF